MNDALPFLACAGALVVAVLHYGYETAYGSVRFLLGLYAGAVFAQLGSDLLLTGRAPGFQSASLLFAPLGILLVAPWREALAALPLAFGVARLGCLPYGCCYEAGWGALPEIAGYVGLHLAARRWPLETTPIVLGGFGALRLLSLPWRRQLSFDPLVDPAWVAAAWIVAGVALRHRIGGAADAREWLTPRLEPLLRALALMLAVWLLFPLAGLLFDDAAQALLAASTVALACLLALGGPLRARVSGTAVLAFGITLPVGWLVAHVLVGQADARPASPATAIAVVAVAPAFEELLYRERLMQALYSLWGAPAALLLSSALFAVAHQELRMLPIAFAGGLAVGAVVLRTGSLAAAFGLHAGWNLGALGGAPLRDAFGAVAASLP